MTRAASRLSAPLRCLALLPFARHEVDEYRIHRPVSQDEAPQFDSPNKAGAVRGRRSSEPVSGVLPPPRASENGRQSSSRVRGLSTCLGQSPLRFHR